MKLASGILLFLLSLPASALEFGLYSDLLHREGMVAASIRQGPVIAMTWEGNSAVGLVSEHKRGGWNLFLGGTFVKDTDDQVGTHLNFLLGAAYSPFAYWHISHGRFLGIEKDKPNDGLNFLGLRREF